jgi:hypothetical protein
MVWPIPLGQTRADVAPVPVANVFMGAALAAIRWPRIGGGLHIAAAVGAAWFFRRGSPTVIYPFIVGPLVFVGVAYWFGRPRPRRCAVAAVVALPLITLLDGGKK